MIGSNKLKFYDGKVKKEIHMKLSKRENTKFSIKETA
jgi:hypothetical protein